MPAPGCAPECLGLSLRVQVGAYVGDKLLRALPSSGDTWALLAPPRVLQGLAECWGGVFGTQTYSRAAAEGPGR